MNKRTVVFSVIIALVVIAILAAPLMAAKAQAKQGNKLARLAQYLQLTDQQKQQIKPILLNAKEQAKAIRNNAALTPEQKKAKFLEIRKATIQQIQAILTPDQQQKLIKWHQAKQKAGAMKKILAALNLTDAQKVEIKAIREEAKAQALALKSDSSLTDDQKKAKFQEIRKAAWEKIKATLTPEQLAKLKAIQKKHRS